MLILKTKTDQGQKRNYGNTIIKFFKNFKIGTPLTVVRVQEKKMRKKDNRLIQRNLISYAFSKIQKIT